MILRFIKRLTILTGAILTSCLLVFSVTVANLFITGKMFHEKKFVKTEVAVKKVEEVKKKIEQKKPARKPNRQKSTSRSPKAGPRFAMNLAAASFGGGAAISEEMVSDFRGGTLGTESGDVDKKPSSRALPAFQVPAQIKDKEIDALLRLSFCVDVSGRAYNIKVVEETPAGSGLSAAGKEALARMQFHPAEKKGKPVAYCGMEQPFEVKFRD
ncbi:MAG: energy transducer TonB [Fibrobacteraceae bacterium]|nr:energy transducer TonB [Fibrobacteraceae bacterium]